MYVQINQSDWNCLNGLAISRFFFECHSAFFVAGLEISRFLVYRMKINAFRVLWDFRKPKKAFESISKAKVPKSRNFEILRQGDAAPYGGHSPT